MVGLEPDRDPIGANCRPGFGIHERPASRRQHLRASGKQTSDYARLARTEIRLAKSRKDFRDGHAGGGLDLGIGIDERNAEPGREPASDRGFSRTHHADEHDGAASERADEPGLRRWPGARLAHNNLGHMRSRQSRHEFRKLFSYTPDIEPLASSVRTWWLVGRPPNASGSILRVSCRCARARKYVIV